MPYSHRRQTTIKHGVGQAVGGFQPVHPRAIHDICSPARRKRNKINVHVQVRRQSVNERSFARARDAFEEKSFAPRDASVATPVPVNKVSKGWTDERLRALLAVQKLLAFLYEHLLESRRGGNAIEGPFRFESDILPRSGLGVVKHLDIDFLCEENDSFEHSRRGSVGGPLTILFLDVESLAFGENVHDEGFPPRKGAAANELASGRVFRFRCFAYRTTIRSQVRRERASGS